MPRTGGRMGGRYYRESEREREGLQHSARNPSHAQVVMALVVITVVVVVMVMAATAGGGIGGEIVVGCLFLIIFWFYVGITFAWGTEKASVIEFRVGSLAMSRSLQSNINNIAEGADTSTPEGLSSVLTETTLALLRDPNYCIAVYSSVNIYRSREDSIKHFNQLSFEERAKFDEETLVNWNNIKSKSTTIQRASGFGKEYVVITILVAAEGVHKLPTINGKRDLKKALQKLGAIPSNKPLAVEVLWTPQNENDTLSHEELLEDYPLLRSL